jgi:hypothetical protein
MNTDLELELWREQWQSETPVAPDLHRELRRRVERESRTMKIMWIADVLVTISMGGWTTGWALREPEADVILLAAATWTFLAVAWIFTIVISRGKWAPAAMDTASFLNLSIERCRGALARVKFGAWLYVGQMVFCLTWVYRHSREHGPVGRWLFFGSREMDFVWVFTVVFFGALWWYRRRKRGELARLVEIREGF